MLVAAVVAAGCGQGGGASAREATAAPARSKPLTKTALVAKADAFCVANRKAYGAITHRFYPVRPTGVDIRETLPNHEYTEEMLALSRRLVGQLQSLTPPPRLRARYLAYIASLEEVTKLILEARRGAVTDDGGIYLKAWKTRDAGALERFFLASWIGLRRCSPNPYGPKAITPRPPNEPDERFP